MGQLLALWVETPHSQKCKCIALEGKITVEVKDGDIIRVETPGGGNWMPQSMDRPLPARRPNSKI